MRTISLAASALLLAGCGPDLTWGVAYDDAREAGWLMNVHGLADDDRVAVGGSFARGRVFRWDGEDWSEDAIPEVSLLNWTYAFASDDAWAVGADGAILRWDGAAWSAVESPTDQDLWGVWGAAPDDVWAIGGSARRGPDVSIPTVIHWDGSAWSLEATPELERTGVLAYFKVWGSSADDVYVVGDAGAVIHWDGAAWTELFVGASDDLVAVWGTGPDDVVAVGGRGAGVVSIWDGTEWHSEDLALRGLNGVWVRRPGVAHAVGLNGTLVTLRYGGGEVEVVEEENGEALDFHAIHGVGGRLVAVGGNLAVPSDAMGAAWTRQLGDDE